MMDRQAQAEDLNATRASLLTRLHTLSDQAAWQEFHTEYHQLILAYAMKCGCTRSMAFDVLQESMFALMRAMRTFHYDPVVGKFRSYLLNIVDKRIKAAFRRERKYVPLSAEQLDDLPSAFTKDPDLWDREWDNNLLRLALRRLEAKVQAHSYRCFKLFVLDNWSAERVQEVLGLKPNAIYQNRARLVELLQREVAVLERELEP